MDDCHATDCRGAQRCSRQPPARGRAARGRMEAQASRDGRGAVGHGPGGASVQPRRGLRARSHRPAHGPDHPHRDPGQPRLARPADSLSAGRSRADDRLRRVRARLSRADRGSLLLLRLHRRADDLRGLDSLPGRSRLRAPASRDLRDDRSGRRLRPARPGGRAVEVGGYPRRLRGRRRTRGDRRLALQRGRAPRHPAAGQREGGAGRPAGSDGARGLAYRSSEPTCLGPPLHPRARARQAQRCSAHRRTARRGQPQGGQRQRRSPGRRPVAQGAHRWLAGIASRWRLHRPAGRR